MTPPQIGIRACGCSPEDAPEQVKLIALTGGPGAGKTAVLELVLRTFCRRVVVLPEAASLIFGGGFPRQDTLAARQAAQRAIFHVQRELEALVQGDPQARIALCDRGTIDGLAYWPGDPDQLWRSVGSSPEAELARYHAVIHLESPTLERGYNHRNPLRTETAEQARDIDERIKQVWAGHPNRVIVPSTDDFLTKATRAIDALRQAMLPICPLA